MLKQLLRTILGLTSTPAVKRVDPWRGSSGFYVDSFRQKLDEIADALSREGQPVRTRFNLAGKCAELYVPEGEEMGEVVIAQVAVHGSEWAPYEAVVTPLSLSDAARTVIDEIIPLRVKFREAA